MSFYSKYQLERLLADGPAKTFRAVENASGRPVFLHLFTPEGRFLFDTIAARFRDSAGRPSPPLIETGEFSGSLYAVTEVLEPFVNLRAWAESVAPGLAAAPAAPLPDPRPVAGSSTKEPGEFTRMFALQQAGTPPAEADAEPTVPTPAPAKEPGKFTREFMVRAPAPPARPGPSSWPAAPAPEAAQKSSPLPDPDARKPAQPMWPDQDRNRSDDISDLFSSLPGEHVDVEAEQVRAARVTPPERKPFRRAGTFTRMFGPGTSRNETPQQPSKAVSFLFDSGLDPFKSKASSQTGSKVDPPKEAGPGEYTRMIAIPKQGEESLPPAAQQIQPAAQIVSPKGNRALLIAFVLVGVLAFAVIVLVAVLYTRR